MKKNNKKNQEERKFCKEYLALQNPKKNILFASEKYHSMKVTTQ